MLANALFLALAAGFIAGQLQSQYSDLLQSAGVSHAKLSILRSDASAWATGLAMWSSTLYTLIATRWPVRREDWPVEAWAPVLLYLFGGIVVGLCIGALLIPVVWIGRIFAIDQELLSAFVMLLLFLLVLLLFSGVVVWIASRFREGDGNV